MGMVEGRGTGTVVGEVNGHTSMEVMGHMGGWERGTGGSM
jgi:hypothetical protein